MRPYTRCFDPSDYQFLSVQTNLLMSFVSDMRWREVPHREWHPHRLWEYGSIMQQLEHFETPHDAMLVDVGAGGSFFDPMLAMRYSNLGVTDDMIYGDVSSMIAMQRAAYGVQLPLLDTSMEHMPQIPDDRFDITMCISSIEHARDHDAAFRELVRITKPGGYVFITSDFFRDAAHFEQSISRHLQVTPYTKDFVLALPDRFGIKFVGETDLDYTGDYVHNYSFCNICLQKPS